MTPLGPVWVKFSFGGDCIVHTRIQVLFTRITETARYRAREGVIKFERRGGTTEWPYRVVAKRLTLQEAPRESHSYRRR